MSLSATSSHRRGSRVDYLPRAQGPFAQWSEVIDVADGDGLSSTAASARVNIRRREPERDRAHVQDLSLPEAASLRPDELIEVRRPVSYRGMRNYIGRMSLPSQAHQGHAGWFESRNEQENYRDLVIQHAVAQMVSQPLRIEWSFRSGVRSHVPDALHLSAGGQMTLVDVTRRDRLKVPEAVAIFRLAQATAQALGWHYELRAELPPQYQRNVSLVYAHRHPSPCDTTWQTRLKGMPAEQQLAQAATTLGAPARPNFSAVFHLAATRHLFLDLSSPLTADAIVRRRPSPSRSNPCLITP